MIWLLLALGFALGVAVGITLSVASGATGREMERLERQWMLEARR